MALDMQPTSNQAWEIASDPAAPEKKWMAAVTVLGGTPGERKLPVWIEMPWSVMVSGASSTGAVLLFSLLQLALCTKIGELFGDILTASYISLAFGVWFVPCIVFSMLFTYRRLLFGGGNGWVATQWLIVAGYLASISLWAIDGQPVKPWDAGLLAIWNSSCLLLSFGASKWAEKTFNSLNQTIGAKRVLVPMTRCFASIPVLVAGIVVTGMVTSFYLPFNYVFVILTAIVVAGSYISTRNLGAFSTSTAASIATIIWSPILFSNLVLFPAMAITHVWLTITGGPYIVSWIDYAGAFGALTMSAIAPIIGGTVASRHLQARRALDMQRGDRFTSSIPIATDVASSAEPLIPATNEGLIPATSEATEAVQ